MSPASAIPGPEDGRPVLPGIGLAFGGGVVYSISGIGVARGLLRAGVPIVAASGTSGGALVGSSVAAGLGPDALLKAALAMDWRDLTRFHPNRLGVMSGEPIVRFVERTTGVRSFEELAMPFTVVATDILSGREVRLSRGPLGQAVRASCAIPGLFQPVPYGEWLLVDGGISDNLPAAAVRAVRPALVVGVDVLTLSDQYQGRLRTGAHVVLKAYHTMLRRPNEREDRQADLLIMPNVAGCSVMNFRDAEVLIERGEEAVQAILPRLRATLDERLREARAAA